jgi:hypothetical protein
MLNYWRRDKKEVEMNKDDCIMQKLTCKNISAWTHMCKISLEE